MTISQSLRDWWRARRRGDVRVGPKGATGRVYVEQVVLDPEGNVVAKAKPKGTISARVYREATGEWEDLGVIAKSEDT